MKVNKLVREYAENYQLSNEVIEILLDLFEYSIEDLRNYDELTSGEKRIISKEMFDYLTEE